MTISPLVASWFTIGDDVPQPEFLAWAASVESDIAALNAYMVAAGNISTAKLADGAVTALKLGAAAVTEAKIDAAAVTETKIAAGAVSNAKLAAVATATFKGRATAGTGAPEDLTPAQAAGLLRPADGERQLRAAPIYFADFVGGTTNNFFPTTVIGTGTASAGAGNANHPGTVAIASSVSINTGARLQTAITAFLLGGGEVFDFVFLTPAAFTNVLMRAGFLDTTTNADAVDGAYFELNGSGNVTGKTSNNSVRTTSATIATLVASTWYHGRITVNVGATQVLFELFSDAGASLGSVTNTTNIPTAAGRETGAGVVATVNAGSAVTLVTVDYISARFSGRSLQRGALT